MGVSTRQGLPQGQFYYFQAEEERRRKPAADYLTHSHNIRRSGLHGVTNSVGNLPAYQRITLSALTNRLFGPFMTKPHEHTRTFQSFVQLTF